MDPILNIHKAHNKTIINDQYEVIRKVGEGQYGKVFVALVIPSHLEVAIKTINRIDKSHLITKSYLDHALKIKREIQIMKECNHPNVVQLYKVIDDLKYDKILLVLEYCSLGEIDWKTYNHYNEKSKPNPYGLTIPRILRDVLNGLEYLHDYKGIIHRDLKPSNLLVSHQHHVKISDFGVSLILENNANDNKELGKRLGTPAFFAPELCQFVNSRLSMVDLLNSIETRIDKRIDIWSLGVILYCLIFNQLPFTGKNEYGLFHNIVNKPLKLPKVTYNHINKEEQYEFSLLCDLIQHILVKDPSCRISLPEIKNHKFTCVDLLSKQVTEFKSFNHDVINRQIDFSTKLKRFFGAKPIDTITPVSVDDTPMLEHLEPVDDLLDSYFDDSDYGSIDGLYTELEPIAAPPKPPPLNLGPGVTNFPTNNVSPISTGSYTVTIGPSMHSPSMYSPTRNFFDKIKNMQHDDPDPTISSLATDDHMVLEPPSIFKPPKGRKLSITSSSSSLNLNGYLTDTGDSKYRDMSDYLNGL